VIAESTRSRELLALVRRVAPSRATVLIQGESGTGKELVARLLHYWSERVGRPFIAVNCKAFAEGVLESELFGHEKGAFTGASAARAGCFERASGGTLFLDEIGEIGGDFQAKLLRVLQDGEVLRVGGAEPRTVDVRVVAATNRVLRDEVAAGRFREDLYFRLNVIPIQLAPLRERREDILPLARHFLRRHAADAGRPLAFTADAEAALLAHAWRGNVRELENAVERFVILTTGRALHVPPSEFRDRPVPPSVGAATLEATEREAILRALHDTNWVIGGPRGAAKRLGLKRTTLQSRIQKLGIDRPTA